jgi:hypothetical protein
MYMAVLLVSRSASCATLLPARVADNRAVSRTLIVGRGFSGVATELRRSHLLDLRADVCRDGGRESGT